MKKLIIAFMSYTLFAAAALFCFGFFCLPVPDVLARSEFSYKLSSGFCTLLDLMPAVCFTGFLLGCSLAFGKSSSEASYSFSTALSSLFKNIMIMAIIITLLISMSSLVLLPFLRARQQSAKKLPLILNEYISLARLYSLFGPPEQALRYIDRAQDIDPKNEQVMELLKEAELKKEVYESEAAKERSMSYARTDLNARKDFSTYQKTAGLFNESTMDAEEMFQKAREHFDEGDYFGAHYFAVNAAGLFIPADKQNAARAFAGEAWKKIESTQPEGDSEGNIFFRKKMLGYAALLNGKFEDAYYAFYELSQEDARKERDPDVMRYLELSEKRLLDSYFFIDETYNLGAFERVGNIYFSLKRPEGGYDIVLIRGVAEVEGGGGLVRYLRGLQVYSFDADGKFLCSMTTPYAKMKAAATSELDETARRLYAHDSSVKTIPLIMLCSLGRSNSEEMNLPQYTYADGFDGERREARQSCWPMPYEDFSMIVDFFSDSGSLNPLLLDSLSRRAPDYGYSREAFSLASLYRLFYPFMILIWMIFTAIMAWNYRLDSGAIFKFKWIFILPVINAIFYFAHRCVEYIIRILNFVFIALAGTNFAFLAGIVIYVVLLFAVSIAFLARKRD